MYSAYTTSSFNCAGHSNFPAGLNGQKMGIRSAKGSLATSVARSDLLDMSLYVFCLIAGPNFIIIYSNILMIYWMTILILTFQILNIAWGIWKCCRILWYHKDERKWWPVETNQQIYLLNWHIKARIYCYNFYMKIITLILKF